MKNKIKYTELDWKVQVGILGGWLYAILFIIGFLIGFFLS